MPLVETRRISSRCIAKPARSFFDGRAGFCVFNCAGPFHLQAMDIRNAVLFQGRISRKALHLLAQKPLIFQYAEGLASPGYNARDFQFAPPHMPFCSHRNRSPNCISTRGSCISIKPSSSIPFAARCVISAALFAANVSNRSEDIVPEVHRMRKAFSGIHRLSRPNSRRARGCASDLNVFGMRRATMLTAFPAAGTAICALCLHRY